MILRTALRACRDSPARVDPPTRPPWRVGLVQHRWHPDPAEHRAALAEGVRVAAGEGARLVCLQELTLSPYFAITPDGPARVGRRTGAAARRADATSSRRGSRPRPACPCTRRSYERADDGGLGFNTAICVAPDGALLARTRKTHLPVTAGYYEDRTSASATAATRRRGRPARAFGFPTCWDEWFPEVARAYALHGAEVIVYPTAIGSEPDHPGLRHRAAVGAGDPRPRDRQRHVHGGARTASAPKARSRSTASSFISDPYGRVLVQAPRDEPAVLVADLDLDQRRDWLALFPFLRTRRPDTYGPLLRETSE